MERSKPPLVGTPSLGTDAMEALLDEASKVVSKELGKPEAYVMVTYNEPRGIRWVRLDL